MIRRVLWIMVTITALYSALWFGVAKFGPNFAGEFVQREAERGRVWACVSQDISGFPFSLHFDCVAPQLTITGTGGSSVFAAKALHVTLDVLAPSDVSFTADAPVTAKLKNGDAIALNAAEISGTVEAGFAPVDQALQKARLVVVEPDFVMTGASGKIIAAKAAQAVAGLDRLAQPGAGAHDFNLTLDVETARIPALEAFTQVNEPAALHVGGVLTKFPLPGRGSLVDWLENWRQADGLLALGKATLSNGMTQIEASGPLGFDGEHRLTGKLALKLRGADAVLARFGVSGSLLNPGNLLGSLFGKVKKPAPDGDSGAGGIRLPLTLQGGKVLVGPLPLPFVLQPLY